MYFITLGNWIFLGLLEQYHFVDSPGLSSEELVESGRIDW